MSSKTRPVLTAVVAALIAAASAAAIGVSATKLPEVQVHQSVRTEDVSTTTSAGQPTRQVSLLDTPGGRALTQLAKDIPSLFPRLTGKLSARGYVSFPSPRKCAKPIESAYDGFTWFATANGRDGAVSVTAVSVGPGYATDVLSTARQALRACAMRVTTTNYPTEGAFTATGQQLQVRGWARGDVVLFTIEDSALSRKSKPVTERIDAVAVSVLAPVCADLAASSDKNRNPYLEGTFTGRTLTVAYGVPGSRATPAPNPVDSLTWVAPEPVPFPQFAVADYPGALPEVPLLVDPYLVPEPSVAVTAEPEPPASPAPERTSVTTVVRVPDTVGPGCGWDFLQVKPPAVDFGTLEQQAQKSGEQAAAELAKSGVDAIRERLSAARTQEEYAKRLQEWNVLVAYQEQVDSAQAALTEARERWLAALAQPTPPPPAVTPETPVPSPSPSPVETPVPGPTEQAEGGSPAPETPAAIP